ncbi:hypothetical protein AAMO2058_001012800 [Amorphochlora amoebiformis]
MAAASSRRVTLVTLSLAFILCRVNAGDLQKRIECEKSHCGKEISRCKEDRVCSVFQSCQRNCPANRPDCLAHCVIGHGMLPSVRGIRLMANFRRCASTWCGSYFPSGDSCTKPDSDTLAKIALEDCERVKDDPLNCPATCLRELNTHEARETFYHCQHSSHLRKKKKFNEIYQTLNIAIESCQRYIVPGCRDIDEWKDPDGDTCEHYVKKGVCRDGELLVTEADLRRGCQSGKDCAGDGKYASQACCACGGGVTSLDCKSAEAQNCTQKFLDLDCAPEAVNQLNASCSKYGACFEHECAKFPMKSGEALHGTILCEDDFKTNAEMVFVKVTPSTISSVLTYDSLPTTNRKDNAISSIEKSKEDCGSLGWNKGVTLGLAVVFKDLDGDVNTYKQTQDGLTAYVKRGKHGVKKLEGLVSRFSFLGGVLDDSYGMMKMQPDVKESVLTELASLAHDNGVPGLERFYHQPQSCRSGFCTEKAQTYNTAKGICQTNNARMCTPEEILRIHDHSNCSISKKQMMWTGSECNSGMTTIGFRFPIPFDRTLTKKDLEMNAIIQCSPKTSKALPMCCADKEVRGDLEKNTESFVGKFDYHSSKLRLRSADIKRGSLHLNLGVYMSGLFHRSNMTFSGKTSVCAGGSFNFTSEKEILGYSAFESAGFCLCAHGAPPTYAIYKEGSSREKCMKMCDKDSRCRGIGFQEGDTAQCRLYLSKLTARYKKPDFEVRDQEDNYRCEITKTSKNSPNATCYLREGDTVQAPIRFADEEAGISPILACADGPCHSVIAACRWDEQCIDLLTCISSKACYNATCLKACKPQSREAVIKSHPDEKLEGDSIEVIDLIACIYQNSCAKNRGEDAGEEEDTDVPPGAIRIGFPLKMSKELRSAIDKDKESLGKEVIDEIAKVLNENSTRFIFKKFEDSEDSSNSELFVFDILPPIWETQEMQASPRRLYRRLHYLFHKDKYIVYITIKLFSVCMTSSTFSTRISILFTY